ncbi:MAG TPA: SepM family pheromone-processing serine protease [Bacilli bacterium]
MNESEFDAHKLAGDNQNVNGGRHRRNPRARSEYTRWLIFFAIAAILGSYVLVFMPTQYVIFSPGTAEEVKPMIHVQDGDPSEQGTFMLTTVRMTYANLFSYLYASVTPHTEILQKKNVFSEGENESEYSKRQQMIMIDSQTNAMQAAYKRAGVPYHVVTQGTVVLRTIHDLPVAKVLKSGDKLIKLDRTAIKSSADVYAFMEKKQVGDTVTVTFERNGKVKTAAIVLVDLSKQDPQAKPGLPRPGLGLVPADLMRVQADDPAKQVSIQVDDIGGPSAGLMFSLEIFNQLTPGDLTKGYRIAGTGEIDPQGNVGVIGGIRHKVVAADREKADIFFAPEDLKFQDPKYPPILNYSEAVAEAKAIGTKMKVVPVKTMDDALAYLKKLSPKTK